MAEVPDESNFYSSLHTALSRERLADLFEAHGWQQTKPGDWDHLEVPCSWAALVIESETPILMHGPVADVETNAERLLVILQQAGIAFTAESYDATGKVLQEWRAQ